MEEKFLSTRRSDEVYDPFESPPNIKKAEDHHDAMKVGIDLVQDEDSRVCPCCENIIEKQQINLCCKDEDLLFLGVGYPLFYKLTKYIAIIVTLIFIISGSGFYFLVTIKCTQNCIYFFGVPIINLQIPARQTIQMTNAVNVVTALVILVVVLVIKSKVNEDINQMQSKVNSPQQYTIIVQNLPQDITEQKIKDWSKQKFGYKPITINFAYNVTELAEAFKKRHESTIKLNKIMISKREQQNTLQQANRNSSWQQQIKQITNQIKRYDRILNTYKQENIPCRKLGTAFLTFAEQKIVIKILQKYQSSFVNSFIRNMLSTLKSAPLQYQNRTVIVNRAPAPREVIWKNLSFSFFRTFIAEVIFIATMIALIFLAFKIQFKVVQYAYQLRTQSTTTGNSIIFFQALTMSLIVVLLNSLLRLVIKYFADVKKYYSYTNYHSSFCLYYCLMYSLNTCFMIYIVHGHRSLPDGTPFSDDAVLLYDIHLIMLANAFSEPLFKVFDPMMWVKILWKNYVESLKKQKNPYTQAYANSLWQGYEISNADNYQYIFRILIVTTWYAHSAPLGVVFSLIALFFDYWIGKYLLLRVYKRPQNISKQIATPILMSLQLMPIIYICGVLQYTYKVSSSANLYKFLSQFLQYGITLFVILLSVLGYFMLVRKKQVFTSEITYDEVQIMFPYNYETENPITKLKGEMKYLFGVLNKRSNGSDNKLIKELLDMKRKSLDDSFERQSQIVKIKKKNMKKLSSISMMQLKEISRSSASSN